MLPRAPECETVIELCSLELQNVKLSCTPRRSHFRLKVSFPRCPTSPARPAALSCRRGCCSSECCSTPSGTRTSAGTASTSSRLQRPLASWHDVGVDPEGSSRAWTRGRPVDAATWRTVRRWTTKYHDRVQWSSCEEISRPVRRRRQPSMLIERTGDLVRRSEISVSACCAVRRTVT